MAREADHLLNESDICRERRYSPKACPARPRPGAAALSVAALISTGPQRRTIDSHYQLGNLRHAGLSHGLTCEEGCPRVTVRDRSSPGLMAR
jgi:hypothetical protein